MCGVSERTGPTFLTCEDVSSEPVEAETNIKMSGVRMTLNPLKAGDVIVKGIIFDMDGTLCQPQTWMFGKRPVVCLGS